MLTKNYLGYRSGCKIFSLVAVVLEIIFFNLFQKYLIYEGLNIFDLVFEGSEVASREPFKL